MSEKLTSEIVHTKWPGLAITFQQTAVVVRRDTKHLGSLARTRLVIDDILKDPESVHIVQFPQPDQDTGCGRLHPEEFRDG